MDFKATIELVKYTLALSGACLLYTIEKLTPAPTNFAKYLALMLLILFFFSALGGVFIFSAATAALHGEKRRTELLRNPIKYAAYVHIGLLGLGVLLLGFRLVDRVLHEVPAPPSAVHIQR